MVDTMMNTQNAPKAWRNFVSSDWFLDGLRVQMTYNHLQVSNRGMSRDLLVFDGSWRRYAAMFWGHFEYRCQHKDYTSVHVESVGTKGFVARWRWDFLPDAGLLRQQWECQGEIVEAFWKRSDHPADRTDMKDKGFWPVPATVMTAAVPPPLWSLPEKGVPCIDGMADSGCFRSHKFKSRALSDEAGPIGANVSCPKCFSKFVVEDVFVRDAMDEPIGPASSVSTCASSNGDTPRSSAGHRPSNASSSSARSGASQKRSAPRQAPERRGLFRRLRKKLLDF